MAEEKTQNTTASQDKKKEPKAGQDTTASKLVRGALDLAKPLATFDLQNDVVGQTVDKAYDMVSESAENSLKTKTPKKAESAEEEKNDEEGGKNPGDTTLGIGHEERLGLPGPKATPADAGSEAKSGPSKTIIEGSFTDKLKETSKPSTPVVKNEVAPANSNVTKRATPIAGLNAPKAQVGGKETIEGKFQDVSKPQISGGRQAVSGSARKQLTAPAPERTASPAKQNPTRRSSMVNPGLGSYRIHH